ncbi:hypothetical protein B0I35DRAFT_80070 [Stachybotrys elegans]|uniref:Uncharacterized protein n=1 Tax=Stachybotrys elegans TaxID=80388 RepID=A0A8K0SN49_9HYPO|nr:hypothetical protein B0I35DRAFT_80070 [Stachybotrys elegans]
MPPLLRISMYMPVCQPTMCLVPTTPRRTRPALSACLLNAAPQPLSLSALHVTLPTGLLSLTNPDSVVSLTTLSVDSQRLPRRNSVALELCRIDPARRQCFSHLSNRAG